MSSKHCRVRKLRGKSPLRQGKKAGFEHQIGQEKIAKSSGEFSAGFEDLPRKATQKTHPVSEEVLVAVEVD